MPQILCPPKFYSILSFVSWIGVPFRVGVGFGIEPDTEPDKVLVWLPARLRAGISRRIATQTRGKFPRVDVSMNLEPSIRASRRVYNPYLTRRIGYEVTKRAGQSKYRAVNLGTRFFESYSILKTILDNYLFFDTIF